MHSYDQVAQDYENLKREARQANKEDREKLELLELLLRHPGWKVALSILAGRKQELGDAILQPAMSMDGALVLEGIKGEMRGILYLEESVARTIAGLKIQFEESEEGN